VDVLAKEKSAGDPRWRA